MEQGMVVWFLWLTIIVTALLSPLVLWRYGVAVLGGMSHGAGPSLPPSSPVAREEFALTTPTMAAHEQRLRWDRVLARRISLAWFLAFAMAGLLVAPGLAGPHLREPVSATIVCAVVVLLPALPTISIALGRSAWQTAVLGLAAVFLGCCALALILPLAQGVPLQPKRVVQAVATIAALVVMMAWQPLFLMALCGASRARNVMPVLFAALIVFAAAPFLGAQLLYRLAGTEAGSQFMLDIGLVTQEPLFVLLALPFALLAFWRLHRLSAAYQRKQFSDVQLLARAWWLMTLVPLALPLIGHQDTALLLASVVVSVALWPAIQNTVFRVMQPARGAPPARTLLVLRVFGWRARTQRLFDRVVARWRLHGPVTVIAAPDVVARTVDPVDFVDWLIGRTGVTFVRDAAELQARLASIDDQRDPDARFRINEFCCADTTWRATVVALIERADAVLMDLRDVTAQHAGCEFELRQLAARIDPSRVVLLVDDESPRDLLRSWLGVAADRVRWLPSPGRSSRMPAALLPALFAAAR